jgi:hypothetical protein
VVVRKTKVEVVSERQHPQPLKPRTPLDVWRCPKCGKILMKLHLAPGSVVEIECKTCKTYAIREAA